MNSAQVAAFEGANTGNSAFAATDLSFLIAGIVVTAVLLWTVWVVISSYRAWGRDKLTGDVAGGVILRALFICVVTIVIASY